MIYDTRLECCEKSDVLDQHTRRCPTPESLEFFGVSV